MEKVKYFERNTVGRDFVVGDLHGCLEEFNAFKEFLKFDESKDRMFSVGDLVDRGPDSAGCLNLLYEPWFHAVRGNHEQMMIDSVIHGNDEVVSNWIYNGGMWHREIDPQLMEELAAKANELPLVIVIGKDDEKRINIVHAELYKAKDEALVTDEDIDEWFFMDYQEDSLIWGRSISGNHHALAKVENPGLSKTIVGHTPLVNNLVCLNHVFIDLGACYYHHKGVETKMCVLDITNNRTYIYNMSSKLVLENPGLL